MPSPGSMKPTDRQFRFHNILCPPRCLTFAGMPLISSPNTSCRLCNGTRLLSKRQEASLLPSVSANRGNKVGFSLSNRLQAPVKPVVFRIADFRIILDVIFPVMIIDKFSQFTYFSTLLAIPQPPDNLLCRIISFFVQFINLSISLSPMFSGRKYSGVCNRFEILSITSSISGCNYDVAHRIEHLLY